MRVILSSITIFLVLLITRNMVHAQYFLLISPSAQANGMGEVSVALHPDDPLAPLINPAHLGIMSLTSRFNSGYNYVNLMPDYNLKDVWYSSFGMNAGYNFKNIFPNLPPISLGIGYSQINANITSVTENDPDGSPELYYRDKAIQFSVAAGIDYGIRTSLGYTLKIYYNPFDFFLDFPSGLQTRFDSENIYDLGLALEIPVSEIISKMHRAHYEFLPSLSPLFDINLGISKNNMNSDKVLHSTFYGVNLRPRIARIGINYKLGAEYKKNNVTIMPITFQWSLEANDNLITYMPDDTVGNEIIPQYWEYQDWLGDIKVFDELILGNHSPQTIHKKGWELTLFEFISFRGGRFEEGPGYNTRRFSTTGLGIRLSGLCKAVRIFMENEPNDNLVWYLATHLDIQYNSSNVEADEKFQPFDNTKFWGLSLSFSN